MTKRDAEEAFQDKLFEDFTAPNGKIVRVDKLEDDLIVARLVSDGLREENVWLRSELARYELLYQGEEQLRRQTEERLLRVSVMLEDLRRDVETRLDTPRPRTVPLWDDEDNTVFESSSSSDSESEDTDSESTSGAVSPALWM